MKKQSNRSPFSNNAKASSESKGATEKSVAKKAPKIRKIQPAPEVGSINRAARIVLHAVNAFTAFY